MYFFVFCFELIEDVWEVLQSQFEKTQGLNIPLDGSSLEQSSQITHIQYYQNGNGKENFASQGNGNHKPTQFITNGAHSGSCFPPKYECSFCYFRINICIKL